MPTVAYDHPRYESGGYWRGPSWPETTYLAAKGLKFYGYHKTAVDERDNARQMEHGVQLKGQFLLDRDGIVRWANIECAKEGLPGFGKFPTDEALVGAVQALG